MTAPSQRLEPGDLVTEAESSPGDPRGRFRSARALLILREATWAVGIGRAVRHVELFDPSVGIAFWSAEWHWRLLCRPKG